MRSSCVAALLVLFATCAAAQPRRVQEDVAVIRTASGLELGLDGRPVGRALKVAAPTAGRATLLRPTGAATDGQWNELTPPARVLPLVEVDTAHDRLVEYGGVYYDGVTFRYTDDVWMRDLNATTPWRRIEIAGDRPEPRLGPHVYDPVRHRFIVFAGFRIIDEGGTVEFRYYNDTWALELDGTPHWTRLATSSAPPENRSGTGLAYDAARDRLVALGGFDGNIGDFGLYYEDLWELPLGDPNAGWHKLERPAGGPGARAYGFMAVDNAFDQLVAYGGSSDASLPEDFYHRDIWTLGLAPGASWSEQAVVGDTLTLRGDESVAWDDARRRLVVSCGYVLWQDLSNDLWTYDFTTHAWTSQDVGDARPLVRQDAGCAIDAKRDRYLLVGGWGDIGSELADSWSWPLAGGPWQEASPPGAPLAIRFGPAAAFDPAAREVILFGGGWFNFDYDPGEDLFPTFNDLQAWNVDQGTWRRFEASGTKPAGRWNAATAFDPVRRRLWIVGGERFDEQDPFDTWSLDLAGSPTWHALPAGGPRPPRDGVAVFDTPHDRVVLVGSSPESGDVGTWALEGDTWARLATVDSIPFSGIAAAFDSKRDRMIVFGGESYKQLEPWVLTLDGTPTWAPLEGAGAGPDAFAGGRAVYDDRHDRVLWFGGVGPYDFTARDPSVWELPLSEPSAWRRLAPEGMPPAARADHALVFDSARDRMLVTGGWDGFQGHVGSFELGFGPTTIQVAMDVRPGNDHAPVPAHFKGPLPVALLSAPGFDPSRVDVASLRLGGAPGSRSNKTGDWNGDGVVDLTVDFDGRQMTIVNPLALTGALLDGTPIEGAASVSLRPNGVGLEEGGALVLALRADGRGEGIRLAAQLPTAGAWRVELYDVRGRRIAATAGVASAPGTLPVDLRVAPSSGLYFARILFGDAVATTRVAWAR